MLSFTAALNGQNFEKCLICMTAPVFGPLNHVRQREFRGIDLFALVCLENQTDGEKIEHFGGSSTICDCVKPRRDNILFHHQK